MYLCIFLEETLNKNFACYVKALSFVERIRTTCNDFVP